jgi:hypothetical protein
MIGPAKDREPFAALTERTNWALCTESRDSSHGFP